MDDVNAYIEIIKENIEYDHEEIIGKIFAIHQP